MQTTLLSYILEYNQTCCLKSPPARKLTVEVDELTVMLCLDTTVSVLSASSKSGVLESVVGSDTAFDAKVVDQAKKMNTFNCFEGSIAIEKCQLLNFNVAAALSSFSKGPLTPMAYFSLLKCMSFNT